VQTRQPNGRTDFVENGLESVDLAGVGGLRTAAGETIWGRTVKHVITERGVDNLLRCRSPTGARRPPARIAGDTCSQEAVGTEAGEKPPKARIVAFPTDLGMGLCNGQRLANGSQPETIDDIVMVFRRALRGRRRKSSRRRGRQTRDPSHSDEAKRTPSMHRTRKTTTPSNPAPFDRAKELAATLLSERGEWVRCAGRGVKVAPDAGLAYSMRRPGTLQPILGREVFRPTKRQCATARRAYPRHTADGKQRPRSRRCRPPTEETARRKKHGARQVPARDRDAQRTPPRICTMSPD